MPPKLRPVELPALETTLRVDAMYLHAAAASLERSRRRQANIERAHRRIAALNARRDRILQRHNGDSMDAYSELEPIYIQMEGADYALGEAHGPQLQDLAAVHILAAAALESHINSRADEKLSPGLFSLVERFSLEAKWFTIPRMLNLSGFDLGAEPYQSFARLVRYRNGLVHYKPRSEVWEAPGVPGFLNDLGLTQEAAARSLDATVAMIAALAKQLGERKPFWLARQDVSYFDIKVE